MLLKGAGFVQRWVNKTKDTGRAAYKASDSVHQLLAAECDKSDASR